jgi:hypothetical protein
LSVKILNKIGAFLHHLENLVRVIPVSIQSENLVKGVWINTRGRVIDVVILFPTLILIFPELNLMFMLSHSWLRLEYFG